MSCAPCSRGLCGGRMWALLALAALVAAWCWARRTAALVSASAPLLREAHKILLVTAHPDDEAFFFTPTIVSILKHQPNSVISLLCLSSGACIDVDSVVFTIFEGMPPDSVLSVRRSCALCAHNSSCKTVQLLRTPSCRYLPHKAACLSLMIRTAGGPGIPLWSRSTSQRRRRGLVRTLCDDPTTMLVDRP